MTKARPVFEATARAGWQSRRGPASFSASARVSSTYPLLAYVRPENDRRRRRLADAVPDDRGERRWPPQLSPPRFRHASRPPVRPCAAFQFEASATQPDGDMMHPGSARIDDPLASIAARPGGANLQRQSSVVRSGPKMPAILGAGLRDLHDLAFGIDPLSADRLGRSRTAEHQDRQAGDRGDAGTRAPYHGAEPIDRIQPACHQRVPCMRMSGRRMTSGGAGLRMPSRITGGSGDGRRNSRRQVSIVVQA